MTINSKNGLNNNQQQILTIKTKWYTNLHVM